MKKKNVYLTSRQVERIEILAKEHNLSFAEMLRRALDASPVMLQAAVEPLYYQDQENQANEPN